MKRVAYDPRAPAQQAQRGAYHVMSNTQHLVAGNGGVRAGGGVTLCGTKFVPRSGIWTTDPRVYMVIRGRRDCPACLRIAAGTT